jgi:rhodanese-related sulfurtransferase
MSTALHAASVPTPAGYRDLPPGVASGHLGEFRLIDVREPDEYVGPLGHIDGASLVPLATVPEASAGWDKGARLLMICRSGGRSGRAAAFLASSGFTDVYNLAGGMLEWNAQGLPVVARG